MIEDQSVVLRRRIEIFHVEHRFISIYRNLRIKLVDIDSIVKDTENKCIIFDRIDRAVDNVCIRKVLLNIIDQGVFVEDDIRERDLLQGFAVDVMGF